MLRSLWLLFVYVSFLGASAQAPFVATLGYVWVDTFGPQSVAYILLNQIPVAMIMGAAAIVTYILFDRRSPPPLSAESALMIVMVIWVNLTMIWAEVPDAAWEKWNWAVKTLAFATFIPLVIRSRIQIEAFAQTYVFSLAANFVPFGLKTLISGGGYGANLGLVGGNTGLSEGGLLSTVCLMAVPLSMHLAEHSQLIPQMRLRSLAYWSIAGLAVATAIGTYERSALIGIVVLGAYMWIRTKHKCSFGIVAVLVGCFMIYATSSAWNQRVATIGSFERENSAYTRILVWRWTLTFAATHPFGGGFASNLINRIELPGTENQPATVEFGRAFHSIYFEMLGELGYPGLGIFLLITAITFFKLRRLAKKTRADPELAWVASLSDALQSGLAVFLSSGAFLGIAFQPMYWYFIAMSISLSAYVWRAEQRPDEQAWRGRTVMVTGPGAQPVPGWRGRPSPVGLKPATPPR
ncbi:MAG TPA: putative O-glycosylation ligase, exosortase A system-associated [Rhodopila sp.]